MPNPASATLPNPASYTVEGDTVKDNVTGLVWQRTVPTQTYDWAGAKAYCASLSLGGLTEWRLPSRIELVSLVDFTKFDPSIDTTAFPSTPSSVFWSSSPVAVYGGAWYVDFHDGGTYSGGASSHYHAVRCVR
jgi:hypothetical protein